VNCVPSGPEIERAGLQRLSGDPVHPAAEKCRQRWITSVVCRPDLRASQRRQVRARLTGYDSAFGGVSPMRVLWKFAAQFVRCDLGV